MTEVAEYVEARPGPGMPERWSYHWWQHERRAGLYQACRQWGLVVRWRRSETSGSLLYPQGERANNDHAVVVRYVQRFGGSNGEIQLWWDAKRARFVERFGEKGPQ